jgi:PAS domain S-box-containing protein
MPISSDFQDHFHADDPSFLSLAHRAPVMIWMSGLDLGCFYFNRAWLNFRGRLLSQEYGNGWAEGVHPADLEHCVTHYTDCFAERVPFVMKYRLQHYSGEYHWILDRGAPHYAVNGRFLGYFGGCAETESLSPAIMNLELRTSLAGVAAFARDLAEARLAPPADGSPSRLKAFAQSLHHAHGERAREMRHAACELEALAIDMLAHGAIPAGACLK